MDDARPSEEYTLTNEMVESESASEWFQAVICFAGADGIAWDACLKWQNMEAL